jgi:hypothetical protein
MTWGSASADRSIIASGSLPRTPVPPPVRAGTPGHRGTKVGALRSIERRTSLGPGNWRSSEHRAPDLIGTGNSERFGVSGPPPRTVRVLCLRKRVPGHRDQADRTLRGAVGEVLPGQDVASLRRSALRSRSVRTSSLLESCSRCSFECRVLVSRDVFLPPGVGPLERFGASRALPRWDQAIGALRSPVSQVPLEQGPRALRSTGASVPPWESGPLRRVGTLGTRGRITQPLEVRQTELFGVPARRASREVANEALRSVGRGSHRTGTPSSEGRLSVLYGGREPHPTGKLDARPSGQAALVTRGREKIGVRLSLRRAVIGKETGFGRDPNRAGW